MVAAIGQGTAHPDIVGRRKADVFLLRQEHGVRRQFALQLRTESLGEASSIKMISKSRNVIFCRLSRQTSVSCQPL